MSETTLWTNSSPSSTFAATTITVSDMSSYDYIKVYAKRYASDSADAAYSTYMPYSDFSASRPLAISGVYSGVYYTRSLLYSSSTRISISSCTYAGDGTVDNSRVVPIRVVGVKKVSSGGTSVPFVGIVVGQGNNYVLGQIQIPKSDSFQYNKITCNSLSYASGLYVNVDGTEVAASLQVNQSVTFTMNSYIIIRVWGNQSGFATSSSQFTLERV